VFDLSGSWGRVRTGGVYWILAFEKEAGLEVGKWCVGCLIGWSPWWVDG